MPTYNIDAICMDLKFDAWHCLLLIDDNVPGDKIGTEAEVLDSERIHSMYLFSQYTQTRNPIRREYLLITGNVISHE